MKMPFYDIGSGWSGCKGGLVHLMIVFLVGIAYPQTAVMAQKLHRNSTTQPACSTMPANKNKAINPHWSDNGCPSCHQVAPGASVTTKLDQIDTICLNCHDGQQAKSEPHPVGRLFNNKQVVQPEDWPAPNGKLGCVTCHNILTACQKGRTRPEDNPSFLRSYEPGKILQFCANCHSPTEKHEMFNPHVMLDKNNVIINEACLFCHTQHVYPMENAPAAVTEPIPKDCLSCHNRQYEETDWTTRAGRPKLKTDEPILCLYCHRQHVDYFEPGHIGRTAPPEFIAYMAAAESTPPGLATDNQSILQALNTNRKPSRLHLSSENKLVCSTCHNPHQEGLFPDGSALGHGARPNPMQKGQLQFRGLGKNICSGCHNK